MKQIIARIFEPNPDTGEVPPLRRAYRKVKSQSFLAPIVQPVIGFTLDHIWASELHCRRVANVFDSPDYALIPRVADAGRVVDGILTMHNGIKVHATSYYGHNLRYVLQRTGGVHEPFQERIFAEVLATIPPGSTMVELGSFWAFYSLWFATDVDDARTFMVEPDPSRLAMGERNFALNHRVGRFINAAAGTAVPEFDAPLLTVDGLCAAEGIHRIALLHSDIQGAELAMLEGATECFRSGTIDNVFLSTHSPELHSSCREFLIAHGLEIIADVDLDLTDSEDGLIVARAAPHHMS